MLEKIKEAKDYIYAKLKADYVIGIILGTGLGSLASEIQNAKIFNYSDIPNFNSSTVTGHEGKLIAGNLCGKNIIAMSGRFHYYEGYTMQQVTFPVRVMHALGVNTLIATNAAGGLRTDLSAGNIMLIKDHINLMGNNPLIGKNYEELGVRFPDLSNAYDENLIAIADSVAKNSNIDLKHGVYAGVTGPTYSTKAELKMLITIGADAIGMSTVPEVIVAKHSGMKVLGLSCITDSANPDIMNSPSHEEILKVAEKIKPVFTKLVKDIILAI